MVQRQLYSYMSNNNLFFSSQHGFRPRLPTETALLTVSDHILAATDRQELTLLYLLKLSKCLDMIDHSKLLSKLQAYLSIRPGFLFISVNTPSLSVLLTCVVPVVYPNRYPILSVFYKAPVLPSPLPDICQLCPWRR